MLLYCQSCKPRSNSEYVVCLLWPQKKSQDLWFITNLFPYMTQWSNCMHFPLAQTPMLQWSCEMQQLEMGHLTLVCEVMKRKGEGKNCAAQMCDNEWHQLSKSFYICMSRRSRRSEMRDGLDEQVENWVIWETKEKIQLGKESKWSDRLRSPQGQWTKKTKN